MSKQLTIKNKKKEKYLFKRRCIIVACLSGSLFLLLFIRLYGLQVFQYHNYADLSRKNFVISLPIEPTRGLIFDRHNQLIAKNKPVFSLTVIPNQVPNLSNTLSGLQKLLHISNQEIETFYHNLKQYRPYQPIPLRLQLTEEEIATFYVNRYRFDGVDIQSKMIRQYPFGETLGNVIGHVGRINKNDLATIDSVNYSASDYIGKTGIEKYYENQLHGKVGFQEAEANASGKILRTLKQKPAISGDNLYLTIDTKLQKAAKKALQGEAGAVVAIQPKTGDILALLSSPGYDPNWFVSGISPDAYQKLLHASNNPLYDRATRGQFAPGSTIKPFIAVGALNAQIITPSDQIYDPGYFQLKGVNHVYHDWKKSGHGWVNLTKAIAVSSDTYFYNLAVNMGIDRIDKILTEFGFGHKTGIDTTDENTGLLPSRQWKSRYQGQPWYIGDTIITGIGQGFLLATPLQLAQATTTLANRGVNVQPHLLLKKTLPNHQWKFLPIRVKDTIKLKNSKTWQTVIASMQAVVKDPAGTGWRFGRHLPYSIAAKTGTAQVYTQYRNEEMSSNNLPKRLRNNMLFICFAPIKDPKIALVVITEHSTLAPVVARKIIDYYLLKEKYLYHEDNPRTDITT
jgi:penicillin-binding protein 2